MHSNGERSAVSNRPSLLSSASLAEGSGNRILGNLEHNSGAKSGVSTFPRRSMVRGRVFGAAIVCVLVAVSWMWFSGGRSQDSSSAPVPALSVNPAVSPAVVAAIPTEVIPPAAAIINDESVVATAVVAKPTVQTSSQPVSGALAAVPASPTAKVVVAKSAKVVVAKSTNAVAAKSAKVVVAKSSKAVVAKSARVVVPTKSVAVRKKPSEKRIEQAKPIPEPVEVDGDVALLAALLAPLRGQSAIREAALTKQLEKCRLLDLAQAEQCRAQACAGTAKTEKACQLTEITPAVKGVLGL